MTTISSPQPVISAGVDWVTCSAQRASKAAALFDFGEDLLAQEEVCGGVPKQWGAKGYSGHTCGAVQVGFNGRDTLVRVSGASARECASELLYFADNVSRFDMQVTYSPKSDPRSYPNVYYGQSPEVFGRRGRPLSRTLIQNSDGGSTFYLGKGASDQYGRVYDKAKEQKKSSDTIAWRFEVEHKRKSALSWARGWLASADRDSYLISAVYHWFDERGCHPPFSSISRVNSGGSDRGSDAQANRIRWLQQGVAPVLKKMALDIGWDEALSLLGVPRSVWLRYFYDMDHTEVL
jgi:hypothetical protein